MNTIQIKEHEVFKNCIYETNISHADSLVPYIESLIPQYQSRQLSNSGGWQSPTFTMYDHEPIMPFAQMVGVFVSDLYRKFGVTMDKATLDNYWINVNPPNSYNETHRHPMSCFSTVLYCKVPQNSGKIRFVRPDDMECFVPVKTSNDYNYGSHVIEPKVNTLLLFPSHLNHSVSLNQSNDTRISIAFNWR